MRSNLTPHIGALSPVAAPANLSKSSRVPGKGTRLLLTGLATLGVCLGQGPTGTRSPFAHELMAAQPTTGAAGNGAVVSAPALSMDVNTLEDDQLIEAFGRQGIRLSREEVKQIRPEVLLGVQEALMYGIGNSKVDFSAVQVAQALGLDTRAGAKGYKAVVAAYQDLIEQGPRARASWDDYFDSTISLIDDQHFLSMVGEKGYSPVQISWEDIGRDENSAWGDRISDVGIWVRRTEADPLSSTLTLSVRRDDNFRDKVLMVPSEKIKVHLKRGGQTVERTLPQRLKELGLSSKLRDKNVIVSNQFAIVPVPSKNMRGTWKKGTPPRVAFNFSILPYGSTNFVITDVIEGSSDAVVGPGMHQMLYANIKGKKAPFTASRAEDRQDLLKLEAQLKAKGMDVDVQRYYLIQIPLKSQVKGLKLSNMGTPPGMGEMYGFNEVGSMAAPEGLLGAIVSTDAVGAGGPNKLQQEGTIGGLGAGSWSGSAGGAPMATAPASAAPAMAKSATAASEVAEREPMRAGKASAGLTKVAIGHGETEGKYFAGAGYVGARAEEPIRVTVVYFVTPVGPVTEADMQNFTKAFTAWDSEAIWGGSFVTK